MCIKENQQTCINNIDETSERDDLSWIFLYISLSKVTDGKKEIISVNGQRNTKSIKTTRTFDL